MDENAPGEDLLIRYLDDEMPPEERRALESLLDTDEVLRNRLDELKLSKDAVMYYGTLQQVADVRKIWEESKTASTIPATAKVVSFNKRMRYFMAAASVIIVIIGIRIFMLLSVTPEKIYEQTYIGYQLSESRSEKTNFTKIETAYRNKNYTEVISIARQDSLTAKDQLLSGIAYLQLNDPSSAITSLNTLLQNIDPTYRQDAEFYLGLAYLKHKEFNNALGVLKKIQTDSSHLYHRQISEETIREIEKLQ